jgi:ribosome recycling factor
LHDLEKEVQELTDKYVKKIDDAVTAKEAEIMKV